MSKSRFQQCVLLVCVALWEIAGAQEARREVLQAIELGSIGLRDLTLADAGEIAALPTELVRVGTRVQPGDMVITGPRTDVVLSIDGECLTQQFRQDVLAGKWEGKEDMYPSIVYKNHFFQRIWGKCICVIKYDKQRYSKPSAECVWRVEAMKGKALICKEKDLIRRVFVRVPPPHFFSAQPAQRDTECVERCGRLYPGPSYEPAYYFSWLREPSVGVWFWPAPDGTPKKLGVAVRVVIPHSPAARAELRRDDIVLQVNGIKVTDPEKATSVVKDVLAKEQKVKLTVRRGGKTFTVLMTPEPPELFLHQLEQE